MSKDYEQAIKRLRKEGLIVGDQPSRSQHRKLVLADGSVYVAAMSPSCRHAARNLDHDIRRTVATSLKTRA